MREININESIKILNFYKTLDIRALLVKENGEWHCLFCMVQSTFSDRETVENIYNSKRENLGFTEPKDIKIILETKEYSELSLFLENLRKGAISFSEISARINKSNLTVIDNIILKTSYDDAVNKDGFPELIGELSFDTFIGPLTYLKNKGIKSKCFGFDNLEDLKNIFDIRGLNNQTLKFIHPIPCKILEFKKEKNNMIFRVKLHEELLQSSKIRLQAIDKDNQIQKIWNLPPSNLVKKVCRLSVIDGSVDISSYPKIESIKIEIENEHLNTICFQNFLFRQEIFESDDPSIINEENLTFTVNDVEPVNDFIKYLKENGMKYDQHSKSYKLNNYNQTISFPNSRKDLIETGTKDHFYQELQKEINFAWKIGLFTSTLILSRKYVENLVIDILRKKYPPDNSSNLDIYFDRNKKRFLDFSILLENLKQRKDDFEPDTELILKFLEIVKPFKEKANATTHSIIELPDENYLTKLRLQEMISILGRILDGF